ncbi:hypothetical protein O6H91_05G100800 [Diphasiastrum complanatum]|uniref:Uncharacterized protein n=1 Tax=Diphasiastrum complanatum TaxID=34168 RepID=A0ACC2DRH7_DIPCM|nr:hypothetical protein O6H91_05G100800 [Diphasiastrum complanatum]
MPLRLVTSISNTFPFSKLLLIFFIVPHHQQQIAHFAAAHHHSFGYLNRLLGSSRLWNYWYRHHRIRRRPQLYDMRQQSQAAGGGRVVTDSCCSLTSSQEVVLSALSASSNSSSSAGRRFGQANYSVVEKRVGMRRSREVSYESRGRGWNQQRCTRVWGHDADSSQGRDRLGRPFPTREEFRHWLYASEEPPPCTDRFVFVSYNILSDDNARDHWRELYYHIPMRYMRWGWRKWCLVQELGLWSPDLMCLQEVDQYNDLQEELSTRGYTGVYKARTGMSTDGCAIFWRNNRFRLLQEESIEFKELGLRDNVAQICVFQTVSKENFRSETYATTGGSTYMRTSHVVVANIHVLFNPKRGDIKLGQVRILLERAYSLSVLWGGAPVIVAGDFNSTPMSAIYEFLANSELDISGLDRRTISGQVQQGEGFNPAYGQAQSISRASFSIGNSDERVTIGNDLETQGTDFTDLQNDRSHDLGFLSQDQFSYQWTPEELQAATGNSKCTTVSHKLKLRSAYSEIQGRCDTRDSKGEPLVTTYHRKFMGTVDYVWHTEGLDTLRVLDVLPVEVLRCTRGLPNHKWGSDHMALACELAFFP